MSQEINKEIAEKVMGWILKERPDYHGKYYLDSKGKYVMEEHEWRPSELIRLSWLVVEKICKDDYDMKLLKGRKGYMCTFTIRRPDVMPFEFVGKAYIGEAESAPLAICKAALKTINENSHIRKL